MPGSDVLEYILSADPQQQGLLGVIDDGSDMLIKEDDVPLEWESNKMQKLGHGAAGGGGRGTGGNGSDSEVSHLTHDTKDAAGVGQTGASVGESWQMQGPSGLLPRKTEAPDSPPGSRNYGHGTGGGQTGTFQRQAQGGSRPPSPRSLNDGGDGGDIQNGDSATQDAERRTKRYGVASSSILVP